MAFDPRSFRAGSWVAVECDQAQTLRLAGSSPLGSREGNVVAIVLGGLGLLALVALLGFVIQREGFTPAVRVLLVAIVIVGLIVFLFMACITPRFVYPLEVEVDSGRRIMRAPREQRSRMSFWLSRDKRDILEFPFAAISGLQLSCKRIDADEGLTRFCYELTAEVQDEFGGSRTYPISSEAHRSPADARAQLLPLAEYIAQQTGKPLTIEEPTSWFKAFVKRWSKR